MRKKQAIPRRQRYTWISGTYQAIEIWSAILLLTGQVTASGVFLSPTAFWFSLAGPILGGNRLTGRTFGGDLVLNGIDVMIALLLILGQLTVTGPWITAGSFTIVIGGPASGVAAAPIPRDPNDLMHEFYAQFRRMAVERFVGNDDLTR